uniref:Uncharacterized protein n=1 Tax=Glossina austeni TaxID=7395 RepID=A0A1A9V294_GLOAU
MELNNKREIFLKTFRKILAFLSDAFDAKPRIRKLCPTFIFDVSVDNKTILPLITTHVCMTLICSCNDSVEYTAADISTALSSVYVYMYANIVITLTTFYGTFILERVEIQQ